MSDYEVGYGRPPKKNRFKKGKSGNPTGRPKGTRNLFTEIKRELANQVTVRENGQSKRISKRLAMLKSLVAKGLAGDVKAIRVVLELIAQIENVEPSSEASIVSMDEMRIIRRFLPRALKEARKKVRSNQHENR